MCDTTELRIIEAGFLGYRVGVEIGLQYYGHSIPKENVQNILRGYSEIVDQLKTELEKLESAE